MDPESSWTIGAIFLVRALGLYLLGEGSLSMIPSLALIMGSAPMCGLFKVMKTTLEEKYLRPHGSQYLKGYWLLEYP